MQYKVKTIPLHKEIISYNKVVEPLCNKCKSRDCDNPIEPTVFSIRGVQSIWKVYVVGQRKSMVVDCTGFC